MTEHIPGGYHGKILRVDLTTRNVTTENINEQFCRQYLGGAGFVTYYLWKELKPGVDALSPENILVFALGPASGLSLPGAARYCSGAKSPMTGGIAKSESGGVWMVELKKAGFDAMIIKGRAERPVYLWIHDGEASIKDAGHLWGKETKETEAAIRTELGDKRIQLAMIGPAGENMIPFACIMNGLYDASGRGGLGAVMGSKNLKAVAVRGQKLPEIADADRLKEFIKKVTALPTPMSQYGTGGPEMEMLEKLGNLPVRNFRDGLFPEVKQIHGGVMKDTIRVKMDGCFACHVRCKKVVQCEEPYHVDAAYGGPEYETLAALGSNCGISELKAIAKGNERCNAYSLDTISTGGTISFAMECFERGLLKLEDTGGMDLRFGNSEAMLKCIELITRREGFGKVLAEGSARMAKRIGKGAMDFAMQVKGLECGLHDPRLSQNMGLGYMVSPQGAEHGVVQPGAFFSWEKMRAELQPLGIHELPPPTEMGPRHAALFKLLHLKGIVQDCLAVCIFLRYSLFDHVEIVAAVTGWDTGVMELLRIAERVVTMERLFNVREGFSSRDDVMPERFYQPKTDGALANTHLNKDEFEKARNYFYTLMGWDEKGVPLPAKVEELYI